MIRVEALIHYVKFWMAKTAPSISVFAYRGCKKAMKTAHIISGFLNPSHVNDRLRSVSQYPRDADCMQKNSSNSVFSPDYCACGQVGSQLLAKGGLNGLS
jgi:hypothetical protein